MVENDGSYGVHNAKFAVAVLQKSIKAIAPTAIKDAKLLALTYKLEQNYPNPFNPTTRISFTIPQAGNVKIRVFDIMGNLVKEIYNQNVTAGQYSAIWAGDDARGNKVASGIYFYKLESQNFTVSKKMILMK
jgi:flagellar hook assembly protein FlgD